jgi:hypothetical protein
MIELWAFVFLATLSLLALLSFKFGLTFARLSRAFDKEMDDLVRQGSSIVVEYVRRQNERR